MDTIYREQLLHRLNWRYATKQFDRLRKIDPEDWATLEEALILTPSSLGLQPWKFVVVTDPEMKEKLVAASQGQRQVADCSHLLVFARKDIAEKDVDTYLDRISVIRGVPRESLANLRKSIVTTVFKQFDAKHREDWATHQVYMLPSAIFSTALRC